MAFQLAKTVKTDNFAGLGAPDPVAEMAKKRARESWESFRKFASTFNIGDQARVDGKLVTLSKLEPIGGGLIRVEGVGYSGSVAGNYKPGDLQPA